MSSTPYRASTTLNSTSSRLEGVLLSDGVYQAADDVPHDCHPRIVSDHDSRTLQAFIFGHQCFVSAAAAANRWSAQSSTSHATLTTATIICRSSSAAAGPPATAVTWTPPRRAIPRDRSSWPSSPCGSSPGAALLRWRPNQSLRRRRGRRQLDPSRRGEERRRGRWPTVLLSSATDGGLPLVLARFVRGLSTHQGSGCLRRLRTAATAAKCHRAPVDSHRVADQMPTGPSTSRRRAPHAASPLPRG